ncbi:MAG: hypothetical protein GC184_14495 [Rhizobiales bacterium]|nr:hypothetical protein [Hyphomicrobiales bacterium]
MRTIFVNGGFVIAILIGIVLILAVLQYRNFQELRRTVVQDDQPAFYPDKAFHAVAFLKLRQDESVFHVVRQLRDTVNAFPGARMVYAGKVIVNALNSQQLVSLYGSKVDWDATILIQFDSRDRYAAFIADPAVQAQLAALEHVYWHGMKRSAIGNIMISEAIGLRRLMRTMTFQPKIRPFKPAPADTNNENQTRVRAALTANADNLGRDAIVIVNLLEQGTPEQQKADAAYSAAMFDLMSEMNNGPVHAGKAISFHPETSFDQVALVYYPGAAYFRDLSASEFYQRILPMKQVLDTQATITAPILHRLD